MKTCSFDLTDAIMENELALMSALSQQPVFIAIEADLFDIQPVRLSYLGKNKFPLCGKDVTTVSKEFEARLSCHLALVPVRLAALLQTLRQPHWFQWGRDGRQRHVRSRSR